MKRIAIIGGGGSGLSAAFRLRQSEIDFVLFESAARLGGSIQTRKRDGFLLEGGADSFLSEKPEAVNLAKKLGIENQLISTEDENRRSFLVRNNKLHAVPEGFRLIAPADVETFFKSEILSDFGKVRLANERFLPAIFARDEDVSLADFVLKRFGHEALTRIAQPMIGGIYTANPEKLSLRATQPRFLELEQKYGSVIRGLQETAKQSEIRNPKSEIGVSGARYSLFLSFRDGMQTLTDALATRIPAENLRLETSVAALTFDENQSKWTIRAKAETWIADAVILALPAHQIGALLEHQFPALSFELSSIEHASTATVNVAFRREQIRHALDGFGFVVPFVEGKTLMACTFSSVKFAARAPENYVLLRAFVGGSLQPEMFALGGEEMTARVLTDLRELLEIEGEPLFAEIARWRDSMPQYNVGHLRKAEKIKNLLSEIPSLRLATTAFDGVGVPDSIRHGERAAEDLALKLID